MKGRLSILLLFQGVLLYETLAWQVTMPKEIRGLRGSCLVIPCSFSYTSYPPTDPNRVVWYQWVSHGYPLVYDPRNPDDVIDKFRGKTALYGDPSRWSCSLVIKSLDQSHHGEKLYTWIDPENVGKSTYRFFDVTSTINVDTNSQQPTIIISEGERIGYNIKVECYIVHTCPYHKPDIRLNGLEGSDQIQNVRIENSQWKKTLTRSGVVKTERLDMECIVTHYGGITARATKSHSAKCVHYNITIEPKRADVIEGVAKNFVCTIYHSCQKDLPTISWNYKNMKVSTGTKKLTGFDSASFSNITFLGAKDDDGKKLTCTATFSGKIMMSSIDLHVQPHGTKPVHPNIKESAGPLKPVTQAPNKTLFHREANVMTFDLVTVGLYVLLPLFLVLLVCALAGVFMYKRYHRSSPDDRQKSQPNQRVNDAYEGSDQKRFTRPQMPLPKRMNDTCEASHKKPFSKPQMPSPKSKRRSCPRVDYEDYYGNMEELNMYGNIL